MKKQLLQYKILNYVNIVCVRACVCVCVFIFPFFLRNDACPEICIYFTSEKNNEFNW